ncbi:MAG: hypothetical protein KA801_05180 [Syntrophorhabdaceae bacterium]|nr:hypothetical protein [Syntrophorhabdaceae bacterium]
MNLEYGRTPFLALAPGAGHKALFYHVPSNHRGEIGRNEALWLEGLHGWYTRSELAAGLGKFGFSDPMATLRALLDLRLLVTRAGARERGFKEKIVVASYGMDMMRDCSLAGLAVIRDATVVLAIDPPPRIDLLRAINPNVTSLEFRFDEDLPRTAMLERIALDVAETSQREERVVFALYGNARVGCHPVNLLLRLADERGLGLRILPGVSSFDTCFIDFDFDPFEGFAFLRPHSVKDACPSLHTIIGGVGYDLDAAGRRDMLSRMVEELSPNYPGIHCVKVMIAARGKTVCFETPLALLPRYAKNIYPGGTSIYLPPTTAAAVTGKDL